MPLIDELRQRRRLPRPEARRAIRLAVPGLTAQRVGDELGVHASCISRWELGRREPRGEVRRKYAELLRQLQQLAAESE